MKVFEYSGKGGKYTINPGGPEIPARMEKPEMVDALAASPAIDYGWRKWGRNDSLLESNRRNILKSELFL